MYKITCLYTPLIYDYLLPPSLVTCHSSLFTKKAPLIYDYLLPVGVLVQGCKVDIWEIAV